jgi:hypothetical protein
MNNHSLNIRHLLSLVLGAVIILFIYSVTADILIDKSTGLLDVSSTDKNAGLTISQPNTQATSIGRGSTSIRLKPGTYQVFASDNGYQTFSTVQISKTQTDNVRLPMVAAAGSSKANQIFGELPFVGPAAEYQITELTKVSGNSSGPAMLISAPDSSARQDALNWIRSQGFNPSAYIIQYQTAQVTDNHYTNGLP